MQPTKEYVIIVAGGSGKRMNSLMPKQFLLLHNKPILQYSIEAFLTYNPAIECIVVLLEDQINHWKQICATHNFTLPHTIVQGGKERFHSVKAGLSAIHNAGIVAIHDGVRPLIQAATIKEGFRTARTYKSAVPLIDAIDSIRYYDGKKSYSIERKTSKLVQTPQIFDVKTLQQAYEQHFSNTFTDDASVWEQYGEELAFYEGTTDNIKITTEKDLHIASALLQLQSKPTILPAL